jgi:hypothetical protein
MDHVKFTLNYFKDKKIVKGIVKLANCRTLAHFTITASHLRTNDLPTSFSSVPLPTFPTTSLLSKNGDGGGGGTAD